MNRPTQLHRAVRSAICVLLALGTAIGSAQKPLTAPKEAEPKRTLGRLARTTRVTDIHPAPTRASKALSRVEAGRHLVVRNEPTDGWLPVVMSDRLVAYVLADAVKVLPYEYREGAPRLARNGDRSAAAALARHARGSVGLRRPASSRSKTKGFDSGEFVRGVYETEGYELPTMPADQAKRGVAVKNFEDLRPGDRLYLWNDRTEQIDGAAIFVGQGEERDRARLPRWSADEARGGGATGRAAS